MWRVIARRVTAFILISALLLFTLIGTGRIEVPAWINPFAPLAIDEEPNWLTGLKLRRARSNLDTCIATLSRGARIKVTRMEDEARGAGCALEGVVRIESSDVGFSPARPVMTCELALNWLMYERHALRPIARELLGSPVSRVEHLGVFACRNMYNRADGARSEHARANAIDVARFILADGRRIDVQRDWNRQDEPAAAFLRRARRAACTYFPIVLGPDYNDAHRNHFHLDAGARKACR